MPKTSKNKQKKAAKKKASRAVKRKISAKKSFRSQKKGLKKSRKSQKAKEQPMFEEVTYRCPGCGRDVRVVKVSGYDISSMLCQRCSMGGELMEDEE